MIYECSVESGLQLRFVNGLQTSYKWCEFKCVNFLINYKFVILLISTELIPQIGINRNEKTSYAKRNQLSFV